ncbi:hypothetical protein VitviT2T_006839 [Vitis vinifera]|uniref:KH type-2 domain-containing protein n=1 Tax=Vitis vinifera TaxID=29760 RepID=A0ABY9BX78_VITVI|nr:hypothetical protein VitviT2T_006839 [Vitis vinifera]
MAIANGRLNVVEFLISNGVSLNASNIEKYTLWILQLRDFHMEIIIHATQTQNVLGKKGRKIRELTSVVQKRFEFLENNVELYAEKFNNRVFYAIAQAESLRFKLLGGLVVRRAGYGVLSFVMERWYIISSGQPVKDYINSVVRHVLLKQGVLSIKVKIIVRLGSQGQAGPHNTIA